MIKNRTSKPTATGVFRYPPMGFYDGDEEADGIPCTCTVDCPTACKGEADSSRCRCLACAASYYDAIEW